MRARRSIVFCVFFCALAKFQCQAQEASSSPDTSFWSRITIAVPFFTRHFPHDEEFNDYNWGAFFFVSLADAQALADSSSTSVSCDWGDVSLAGGDFVNSYKRNTAFAAVQWLPLHVNAARIQVDFGGMAGFDLNGGYKGYDPLEPLLGAASIKITGRYFDDPDYEFLNRLGLLMTIIPGFGDTSTAFDMALTVRL